MLGTVEDERTFIFLSLFKSMLTSWLTTHLDLIVCMFGQFFGTDLQTFLQRKKGSLGGKNGEDNCEVFFESEKWLLGANFRICCGLLQA